MTLGPPGRCPGIERGFARGGRRAKPRRDAKPIGGAHATHYLQMTDEARRIVDRDASARLRAARADGP